MLLKIITPLGIKYEGEVSRVQFPAHTGLAEILENHCRMISAVRKGEIVTENKIFPCNGGLLRVEDNYITVICE